MFPIVVSDGVAISESFAIEGSCVFQLSCERIAEVLVDTLQEARLGCIYATHSR